MSKQTNSGHVAGGEFEADTSAHTPTPWFISDKTQVVLRICAPQGGEVAVLYDAPGNSPIGDSELLHARRLEQKANAALIVRACNAHDDLAALLKRCERAIPNYARNESLLRDLHAALAKATK